MDIVFDPNAFFTAMDLISKMAENDGSGSGLDADLLDGHHGSYYLPEGSYTPSDVLAKLLTVHGPGSNLNADLLDGVHIAQILAQGTDIPSAANLNNYTSTGLYHQNSNANAEAGSNYPVALAGMLEVIQDGMMVYQKYTAYDSTHNVYVRTCYNGTWYSWIRLLNQNDLTTINNNLALKLNLSEFTASNILNLIKQVDGSGTGLDADTLDGTHLSTLNAAINAKLPSSSYTASDVLSKLLGVDGPGCGLNADLLDGQHGSYYLPASSFNASAVLNLVKSVDGHGSGLDADTVDAATPSATGGTANAIVKSRSGGTISPDYLPGFEDETGTFRILKLINRRVISSGSPVSYVDFTGLNGNSDEEYILKFNIYKNGTGDVSFILQFNGDTGNNYSSQVKGYVDNGGARIEDELNLSEQVLRIGQTRFNAVNWLNGKAEIWAKTGSPRFVRARSSFYVQQSQSGFDESSGFWNNTANIISSIRFRNTSSNTFYGTVELCKLVDLVIS